MAVAVSVIIIDLGTMLIFKLDLETALIVVIVGNSSISRKDFK